MAQPWHGRAIPRALTTAHFEQAAERLGCDVAAIRAVWDVEANGQHFLADGSVIRRFEPHHFPKRFWGVIGFAPRKGEAPWRASLRLSDKDMFIDAVAVDLDAAVMASSWGAPQIMGFNHAAAGFDSALAMVEHMAEGAPQQLGAFVQLVEGWGLDGAIRAHDWRAFARRYNGTGKIDDYAGKLETAYRRHSGKRSAVVLRVGDRGPAVQELQRALGVPEDGAFGPSTLQAVQAFQRAEGLVADGVVGHMTWTALRARATLYGSVSEMISPPAPPAQTSAREGLADRAAEVIAPGGVVATAAGVIGGYRDLLPDDIYRLALIGGLALIGVVVVIRVIRWALR